MNPDDLDSVMQQEADAQKKKALMKGIGGIGDSLSSRNSVGNYYLGLVNKPNTAGADFAATQADAVSDPIANQQKAAAYMKAKNDAGDSLDENTTSLALKDPNSTQSKAIKGLAPRWGIQVTPEMSGYDVKQLIDPKKMMQTEAESSVNFGNQTKLHEMDNDARLKAALAEIAARAKEHKGEKADADYEKLVQSTEQHAASLRGDDAAKLSSAKLSAIASGRALLKQFAGHEDDMTPDQLSILAADRVKAVTGGVPTKDEMGHMMPSNSGTAWAGLKSNFTNKPEPAHSGGWVKEAETDFQAQEKAARDILKNRQDQITSNPRLKPEDKERISKMAVPPEYLAKPEVPTKVVGGITYQKVPGGWQQIENVGQK